MRTLVNGISGVGAVDEVIGDWNCLGVADQPAGITHGWWFKKWMAADDPRRTRLTSELTHVLATDFPSVAEHLTRLGLIKSQLLLAA
jgi:hypothetical protein